MPGEDSQPATLFSCISPEERIPQDQPLHTIRTIADAIPRASPDDAIYEAVFRYHLQQHATEQPHPILYYLSLRGRDPGEDLLRRVWTLASQVQPLSQCRVSARDGVTDRKTGARGLIVEVSSLRWLHVTAAEVVGGYYATPWQAAAIHYRVEPDGGQWAVTSTRVLWRV
jgi:hypothetical protein